MKVTVKVRTNEARALLAQTRHQTEDFKPVFEQQRRYLATAFKTNAMSSGSMVGGWPPERPGTWSANQGLPARLFRTGGLEASLSNLRGQPNDVSSHSATFGTSIPYAKFHQYGTERMPSREIVFSPPGFADKVADDIVAHLVSGVIRREFRQAARF